MRRKLKWKFFRRSRNRHKSSKSSRNDRNGSVSSHQRKRKKSRTPDAPPREKKRDVRPINEVKNQTFDLSQISSSKDVDNKYFENDDFRIKPFESKKTSKIVYNLETQAIMVPKKSNDEFNGSTECTLNTKVCFKQFVNVSKRLLLEKKSKINSYFMKLRLT